MVDYEVKYNMLILTTVCTRVGADLSAGTGKWPAWTASNVNVRHSHKEHKIKSSFLFVI